MNLTLRTLLAWLDDTLPPAEVREIGKKVNESPYAKELVDRIRSVTRRRRLAVPGSGGSDALDPNLVAAYLDNELPQDQVTELEKKFLTSDVHLAEVAAAHQVLSMLGQKAKVPADAKQRMYRREALVKREKRSSNGEMTEHEGPVTQPIAPWLPPAPEPSRWTKGLAPVAAILGLLLLLGVSVWLTLALDQGSSIRFQPLTKQLSRATPEPIKPELDPNSIAKAADADSAGSAKDSDMEKPGEGANEKADSDAEKEDAAKDVPPAPPMPALGSVATIDQSDGVLLRYSKIKKDWERLGVKSVIQEGDRLAALAHSRHVLQWANSRVTLIGPFAGTIVAGKDKTSIGRIEFDLGKVAVQEGAPIKPLSVRFGGESIDVAPISAAVLGLERRNIRPMGQSDIFHELSVYSGEGGAAIRHRGKETKIRPQSMLQLTAPNSLAPLRGGELPETFAESKLGPLDQELADDLSKAVKPDAPVVASLAEAMDDQRREIRESAIQGLAMLGEYDLVVSALSKPGDPSSRKAAVATLRELIKQNTQAGATLSEKLKQALGDQRTATAEKLISGYSNKEAQDPNTYARLVGYLEDADLGIRELALENLMYLTRRDSLGYNPDKPDGDGLQAWKDLRTRGELKPVAARSEE